MSLADDTTPAVCDNCLGSNPYLEMKRLQNGAECKICSSPFTVFKWNADKSKLKGTANMKKTVICLTCARARNCCQSCLLDLTFGIDVETRDRLLKIAKLDSLDDIKSSTDIVSNAKNTTSRLYNSRQLEKKFENEEVTHLIDNEETKAQMQEKLEKLIQQKEKEMEKEMEKDKIETHLSKDDFVALVKKLPFNGNLSLPPKNSNVKSFFLYGVPSSLTVAEIKEFFTKLPHNGAQENIIAETYIQKMGKFGFIEFQSRQTAEKIAQLLTSSSKNLSKLPILVVINNCPIRVCWATNNSHLQMRIHETALQKISAVVDKQMVKLSKRELSSPTSTTKVNHSKVSKPKHK